MNFPHDYAWRTIFGIFGNIWETWNLDRRFCDIEQCLAAQHVTCNDGVMEVRRYRTTNNGYEAVMLLMNIYEKKNILYMGKVLSGEE